MSKDEELDQEDQQSEEQEQDSSQEDGNSSTEALVERATLPTTKEERDDALAQVWQNTSMLRKYFAPQLNKKEFAIFVGKGRMLGANPFTEEIYPSRIKGEMKVMVSRDFYRRKAQEQDTYDGHRVVAVYEEDSFELVNGEPKHSVNSFADRGDLVGAYAIGWRKDVNNQFWESVKLDEYHRGNYIWNSKPETMIKKVAEAHLLRLMYEGILGNTYTPEEIGDVEPAQNSQEEEKSTEAIIIEETEE